MMGAERRSMVMTEEEKRNTLITSRDTPSWLSVPEHDPVVQMTIIPRGRALGVTMFCRKRIAIAQQAPAREPHRDVFGGRIAEELVFAPTPSPRVRPTTSNAPRSWRATWSRVGACRSPGSADLQRRVRRIFLGRSVTQHKQVVGR